METFLFDADALRNDSVVEHILELDRVVLPDNTIPTITVKLDDTIRKQERDLMKKTANFRIVQKGTGTKQQQEIIPQLEQQVYIFGMIDLCVLDSSGLFSSHDNAMLKTACKRNPEFMGYVADKLAEAFKGSVTLKEEDEAAQGKN